MIIVSLLYAVLVCKRFHRNILLSDSGRNLLSDSGRNLHQFWRLHEAISQFIHSFPFLVDTQTKSNSLTVINGAAMNIQYSRLWLFININWPSYGGLFSTILSLDLVIYVTVIDELWAEVTHATSSWRHM